MGIISLTDKRLISPSIAITSFQYQKTFKETMVTNNRILCNNVNKNTQAHGKDSPLKATRQSTINTKLLNAGHDDQKNGIETIKENMNIIPSDQVEEKDGNKYMKLRKRTIKAQKFSFSFESFFDDEYQPKRGKKTKGRSKSRYLGTKSVKYDDDFNYIRNKPKAKSGKLLGPLECLLAWKRDFETQPINHEMEN